MLSKMLSELTVRIEDLLLDPNNPRFSELGEGLVVVPEARYAEDRVQQTAYERMKSDSFDVAELKDTIKQNGFLPMDRIVVRVWKGSTDSTKRYVVVEGNRRVTALRWLLALHADARETFSEEQLANFTVLPALLLSESAEESQASLILPGLRHVSGVKEWGPYQKAKAVYALRSMGRAPQEAAQSLGLSTRAANKLYKCYLALEQMKADEEFGDAAHPKLFSYFEETFKSNPVTAWLGWSDIEGKFTEIERLREFYGWMVPAADSDDQHKLPEAKSLRSLTKIITDDHALSVFRAEGGSLLKALSRYEADHPEEWHPKVLDALSAVRCLSSIQLRSLSDGEVKDLASLAALIEAQLRDRQTLLGAGAINASE